MGARGHGTLDPLNPAISLILKTYASALHIFTERHYATRCQTMHLKSPRNTKIGRKVAQRTGNNTHYRFDVKRSKSRSPDTSPINAETESVSPIQTSILVGG